MFKEVKTKNAFPEPKGGGSSPLRRTIFLKKCIDQLVIQISIEYASRD